MATHSTREGDDAEPATEHACRQHGRLRHADNGHVEKLARASEAQVAEGGNNRCVDSSVVIGEHLGAIAPPIWVSARVAM